MPRIGDESTPILFWNYSHPEVYLEGTDTTGILFAHLLVFRSHLGVFWSRSIQLHDVVSTDGVRVCPSIEMPNRIYHVSLSSFNSSKFCSLPPFFV